MAKARIVSQHEVEEITVDGTTVHVICLQWSDGGRSYEVYTSVVVNLTEDGAFDNPPTIQEIRNLLDQLNDTVAMILERGKM